MISWRKTWGILHRWLGLLSGLVVFLVSITGCLWVFHEELSVVFYPTAHDAPAVGSAEWAYRPSQLKTLAEREWPGCVAEGVHYEKGYAVTVDVEKGEDHGHIYIHPTSGEILATEFHHPHTEKRTFNFFAFVLKGHLYLWLPPAIGEPIVNYGTIVFVLLLVSGIILWWPRNASGVKQRFQFDWRKNTRWKRKNYDLHNILGFYATLVAFIIAVTGLVIGLPWMARGIYWLTTGGESLPEPAMPLSQPIPNDERVAILPGIDSLYLQFRDMHPDATVLSVNYPSEEPKSVVRFVLFLDRQRQYLDQVYTYDQYTLTPPSQLCRHAHWFWSAIFRQEITAHEL